MDQPKGVIKEWDELYFPTGCGMFEGGYRPDVQYPELVQSNKPIPQKPNTTPSSGGSRPSGSRPGVSGNGGSYNNRPSGSRPSGSSQNQGGSYNPQTGSHGSGGNHQQNNRPDNSGEQKTTTSLVQKLKIGF